MCQNSLSVRSYGNIKARVRVLVNLEARVRVVVNIEAKVRVIRNIQAHSRYKQLCLKLSTKLVQERLLSQDGYFLLTDSGDTIVIGVCFA